MKFIENLMFKKISLWMFLLSFIAFILISLILIWSLYYIYNAPYPHGLKIRFGNKVNTIAKFTDDSLRLINSFTATIEPRKIEFKKFQGIKNYDKNFTDKGFILYSSVGKEINPITVLFDIDKKEKVFVWKWPVKDIFDNSTIGKKVTKCCFRAQHPIIMENGDLISNSSQGPLVRINKNSELVWLVDRQTHHSINLNHNGNIVVPVVSQSPPDKNINPTREDGYIVVDPNTGKVIFEENIRDILEINSYVGLLYGIGTPEQDLIHLNDVETILDTDEFVRKGDLVFSLRNLSTVFLYRPSSKKIIWLKNGPWLKQHDVDYLGDGIFTIFDNGVIDDNYFSDIKENQPEHRYQKNHNSIKKYDMKNDTITEIFSLTENHGIFTPSQGLHRILRNKDVFIEESDSAILHRVSKNQKLIWSYVHNISNDSIGSQHWSRYYYEDELNFDFIKK